MSVKATTHNWSRNIKGTLECTLVVNNTQSTNVLWHDPDMTQDFHSILLRGQYPLQLPGNPDS